MFEEPAATEPEPEAPPMEEPAEQPDDSFDELFSEPAPEESESTDETEEPAESDESDDLLDDLFGGIEVPAALLADGGLRSGNYRTWTDNTAKYHCQARLLGVAQGEIQIAKSDGKVKRVPLRRLSEPDLKFVYGQVVAYRELLALQGAGEKLASSAWSK